MDEWGSTPIKHKPLYTRPCLYRPPIVQCSVRRPGNEGTIYTCTHTHTHTQTPLSHTHTSHTHHTHMHTHHIKATPAHTSHTHTTHITARVDLQVSTCARLPLTMNRTNKRVLAGLHVFHYCYRTWGFLQASVRLLSGSTKQCKQQWMVFLLEMVSSACHSSDTGESCNAYIPRNPGICTILEFAQHIFGILIMCSNLEILEELHNLKTV